MDSTKELELFYNQFLKNHVVKYADLFRNEAFRKEMHREPIDREDHRVRHEIDSSPEKRGHGKGVKEIELKHPDKVLSDNEKLRKLKLDFGPVNWKKISDQTPPEEIGRMLLDHADDIWHYDLDHANLSSLISLMKDEKEERRDEMSQIRNTLQRLETVLLNHIEQDEKL